MIEMHLDSTLAIGSLSFDSIGVLANQKAGETGDGVFVGEQRVFGRSPARKFHQLPIVANVHVGLNSSKLTSAWAFPFTRSRPAADSRNSFRAAVARMITSRRAPQTLPWVSMNLKILSNRRHRVPAPAPGAW